MQESLMKFQEFLEKELQSEFDKVVQSGKITPEKICVLKDAVKLMVYSKELEEMEGGSSEYSGRRGRSRRTGRYMSRRSSYEDGSSRGSSYDGGSSRGSSFGSYDGGSSRGSSYRGSSNHNPEMIEELERMYEEAKSQDERQMIGEWIRTAEGMQ